MDFYRPCNFTNIQGYPHNLPDVDIDKIPLFQGNKAINDGAHIKNFTSFILRHTHAAQYNHEDVRMKLFVLSLEDDALQWFLDKPDNAFDSLQTIFNSFKDKYGDKREGKYLFKELNSIKKRENERVEEFNQRFNGILKDMTQDYKPPDKTLLEQYLEAFCVDTSYEIRHFNPANLVVSQTIAEKLEKDKKTSGKSKVPSFERGSVKSQGKEVKEVEHDPIK